MSHALKCWPEYFRSVWIGVKTFEVRKNDREFQLHDEVFLNEWDPTAEEYTGRSVEGFITYIIHDYDGTRGLQPGYCVFGFQIVRRVEE